MAPRKKTETDEAPATPAPEQVAPPEVLDALGGAPIGLPNIPASRVSSAPAPNGPADSVRESNPLFDEPSPATQKAMSQIALIRSFFSEAFSKADMAARAANEILDNPSPELKEAAKASGFDLKKASQVADELSGFVNKHKPKKPTAEKS